MEASLGWFNGGLFSQSVSQLSCSSVNWLVSGAIGKSMSWLAGWLVGRSFYYYYLTINYQLPIQNH